jgi:hypothetical protein
MTPLPDPRTIKARQAQRAARQPGRLLCKFPPPRTGIGRQADNQDVRNLLVSRRQSRHMTERIFKFPLQAN